MVAKMKKLNFACFDPMVWVLSNGVEETLFFSNLFWVFFTCLILFFKHSLD